jgi:tetratricopeptide (TPR) repeat protein
LDRDRCIAKYHHFKKEYEQAIPYFKDWLKNNPKDIEALDKLANCYEKTGSPELAVTMRERARALEG